MAFWGYEQGVYDIPFPSFSVGNNLILLYSLVVDAEKWGSLS